MRQLNYIDVKIDSFQVPWCISNFLGLFQVIMANPVILIDLFLLRVWMTIDDTSFFRENVFLLPKNKRKILETELKEMVTVRTKSSFKDHMGWI